MKETIMWRVIKYLLSIFMLVLIPIYWCHYGLLNFLWLSDMGLFLTLFGLWLHMPVLISMAVVGVMFTELVWCVDYFAQLLFGIAKIHLMENNQSIKKSIKGKIMKESTYWRYIKYLLTFFVIILIPIYVHYYGWQNFLWLSDVGLFLTLLALWLNSSLLMSMAVVGVLFTELVWCVDYFVELFTGVNLIDLADYMFDSSYPMALRGISLFHVFVPAIWIWYLIKYGYDRRAFWYMSCLYWCVLLATYNLTDPAANINWVFLPQANPCIKFSPFGWVAFLFVVFPLCIFLPSHFVCSKLFKKT